MTASVREQEHFRLLCVLCVKLQDQGLTYRQIAIRVGKRPEQIKSMLLRGQRLREAA